MEQVTYAKIETIAKQTETAFSFTPNVCKNSLIECHETALWHSQLVQSVFAEKVSAARATGKV
jgi:hypothetical protein